MALHYELGQIENWQDLDSGLTQCVCFALMFVGVPTLDADAPGIALTRIRMWEKVHGAIRSDGRFLTKADLDRYHGLRTNASRLTDARFRKQLMEGLERKAREDLQREEIG